MKTKSKKLHVDERVFELIKDMLSAGLTQGQIARALSLSHTTISRVAESVTLADYKALCNTASQKQKKVESAIVTELLREPDEWDGLRAGLDRIDANLELIEAGLDRIDVRCDEVIAALEKRRWRI